MFIQCPSCQAKYRLNLEKIPNRKTFIKCRRCSAPIYIDPQEDGPAPLAETQQPLQAPPPVARTVELSCGECGARYKVEIEPLKKVGLKLKCSACGHKFPVPTEYSEVVSPMAPPIIPEEMEFREDGETPMPVPGEARMDSMFDDLQAKPPLGEGAPNHFSPADGETMVADLEPPFGVLKGEAEAAFRDAVSFGDSGGLSPIPPGKGKIPDDQKYRFFMKPKDPNQPDAGDETPELDHPDDLPTLDAQAPASAPDDLPPLDHPAPPSSAPPSMSLVPLAERAKQPHGPNPPVPGQPVPETFQKKVYIACVGAAVVLLALSAAWGFKIYTTPRARASFSIVAGQATDLRPTLTRKGYFVTNKPSGQKLYVLTGELTNQFETSEKVGWVRLEGIAYDRDHHPLQKGHSYAGNLLREQQLQTMDLADIRAFYGSPNGHDAANLNISKGKSLPYQIVLMNVPEGVSSAKAEVKSFTKQGKSFYLKTFP